MKAIKYFSCIFLLTFQPLSSQDFWHKVNGSFGDTEVTDLCLTKNGILLAYVKWSGLYYTTNSGEDWIKTNYQRYEPPNPLETINDSIFIVGGYEHTYVSNDTGKSWTATGNFDVNSMYYESISQLLYVGTKRWYPSICGIYRSIDFGQNWELIYNFPHLAEGQWVNPIIVSRTNHIILANVIYSSQFGGTYKFNRSTDTGQTWEIIMEDVYFTQLLEDDSSNIYALSGTSGNKLFISEDEGNIWISKNNPGTKCLASDKNGRLFRFYSNHIWYSLDKGDTWMEVDNSGLGYIGISDAVIDQNNKIYLATNEGVYFGEADSIVVSVEDSRKVKSFHLSQNFPNPFNPSTSIQYAVSSRQIVTLKIYDVLGNEIATLVNEEKQPGTYEVEFNTSSIKHLPSSGVYFYHIKSGNFVETKKMLLLK